MLACGCAAGLRLRMSQMCEKSSPGECSIICEERKEEDKAISWFWLLELELPDKKCRSWELVSMWPRRRSIMRDLGFPYLPYLPS